MSSRPRSVPCGAFRWPSLPSVSSTPFSNVAVSIERPSGRKRTRAKPADERAQPRAGGSSGAARLGGIESRGHGELAKSPVLESPREMRRARAARPRCAGDSGARSEGARSSRARPPRSAVSLERGRLPDASSRHLEYVALRGERRRRLVSLRKHEKERVRSSPGDGSRSASASRETALASENEAVRLQDGAARRVESSRRGRRRRAERRGRRRARPRRVRCRCASPSSTRFPSRTPSRPGGGVRHESAAERRDRAFRREDAVRRVVAERGAPRGSSPRPRSSRRRRCGRRASPRPSRRAARAPRSPVRRAPSRDSNTTSLRRKSFSPFSSNLHRLGGAHAVTALGSARLVVLEVPEAHRVALPPGLPEQRLGDRIAGALRAGPGLAVREDDEEREAGRRRRATAAAGDPPEARHGCRRREVDDGEGGAARVGVDREVRGHVHAAGAGGGRNVGERPANGLEAPPVRRRARRAAPGRRRRGHGRPIPVRGSRGAALDSPARAVRSCSRARARESSASGASTSVSTSSSSAHSSSSRASANAARRSSRKASKDPAGSVRPSAAAWPPNSFV